MRSRTKRETMWKEARCKGQGCKDPNSDCGCLLGQHLFNLLQPEETNAARKCSSQVGLVLYPVLLSSTQILHDPHKMLIGPHSVAGMKREWSRIGAGDAAMQDTPVLVLSAAAKNLLCPHSMSPNLWPFHHWKWSLLFMKQIILWIRAKIQECRTEF